MGRGRQKQMPRQLREFLGREESLAIFWGACGWEIWRDVFRVRDRGDYEEIFHMKVSNNKQYYFVIFTALTALEILGTDNEEEFNTCVTGNAFKSESFLAMGNDGTSGVFLGLDKLMVVKVVL